VPGIKKPAGQAGSCWHVWFCGPSFRAPGSGPTTEDLQLERNPGEQRQDHAGGDQMHGGLHGCAAPEADDLGFSDALCKSFEACSDGFVTLDDEGLQFFAIR
jgi:hypothetical protein